jgi:trans-2,3-dihydro-3-hydroxyanthranilate isomerase
LSLDPSAQQASYEIHQGVQMGRPSLLHVDASRTPEGIVATIRGSCVSVMQGEISV